MNGGGGGEDGGRGWEMVAPASAGTTAFDDFSVFPPSLHEGLPLTLTLDSASPPASSSSTEGLKESKVQDEEAAEGAQASRTPISEFARMLVGSGFDLIRSKLAVLKGGGGEGCNGGAFWSFAAVAGLAAALMYVRRRNRRERDMLLFLILDKDERINQLIDQIVKMSEVIAANYKVPVAATT